MLACMLFPGSRNCFALPAASFNWVGPAACARCQQLQIVDLSRTDITEILGSTFAHCSQLQQLRLSRNLRIIEQEAFFQCASLQEVCIPPSLLYIARRAFAGCTQLRAFCKTGKSTTWRGTYARVNAFDKCEHLDKPQWLRFLPPNARPVERRFYRSSAPGLMNAQSHCVCVKVSSPTFRVIVSLR